MKEFITYACGHEGTVQLYGSAADRERKKAWLEGQVCYQCARHSEIERAAEMEPDMPALTGTEKQVAWAESIRAKGVIAYHDRVDETGATAEVQAAWRRILRRKEAKFWIESNDWVDRPASFIRMFLEREAQEK